MKLFSQSQLVALICVVASTSLNGAELIGYYPFEDSYSDSSGSGNDAEPSQNPDELSFALGFRGKALDINDPTADANSGGSVDIPIDANPDTLPGVTFGGWVNIDEASEGEFDGFMAIDNGGWDRGMTVNAQESASFGIASGSAPVNIGEIKAGDWQYVVGSFDIDEGLATIYVGDADPANLSTESDFGDDLTDIGEPVIELGRYDNQDLDALVDDIFVFDEALDEYQVNAIRNLRLSDANLSPVHVAELFKLFDDSETGDINGSSWMPTAGLSTENPGALIDQGDSGKAVVLDGDGNGMLGDPSAFVAREKDSDDDMMDDEWELAFFENLDRDGTGDFDEDGVLDLAEFESGLLPDNKDSDTDGLGDGVETNTGTWVSGENTGTDPRNADTDGDGLADGVETNTGTFVSASDAGTNPHSKDTDGDLAEDAREVAASTDPTDPNSFPTTTINQGQWSVELDIPNDELASIVLDVENDELDFVTNGNTDMWTQRRDAPMAWAPNPNVPEGEMWSVETQVRYNGAEDAAQRVAGLLFYPDEDGLGGSEDGLDFGYGLNDWNNRGVEAQGFGGTEVGDSGQPFISAQDDIGNPSAAFLRIEIVEGGESDEYTFFYKLEEADDWTELETVTSDQDNSRVAMFFKNGGGTAEEDRSVSFTYFAIDDGNVDDFRITAITRTEDTVTLTWSSRAGKTYALEAAPNVSEWLEVDDGIESMGAETTFTDRSPELLNEAVRYYRVREVQ